MANTNVVFLLEKGKQRSTAFNLFAGLHVSKYVKCPYSRVNQLT